MALEPVHEQDFLDCSYGFRPGSGPQQALWNGIMDLRGGRVIDLDIQAFIDSMERTHLNAFLDQRVRDVVLRCVLGKWMQAGIMSEGVFHHPELGDPQGGVISTLVSNPQLHEVLDRWFEQVVEPRLYGRPLVVRFTDDDLLAFDRAEDARRVPEVLAKRLERFGQALLPEKARLVNFRRPPWRRGTRRSQRGHRFDLLCFSHDFETLPERKHGGAQRETVRIRFSRAVRRIGQ